MYVRVTALILTFSYFYKEYAITMLASAAEKYPSTKVAYEERLKKRWRRGSGRRRNRGRRGREI